MNNYFSDDSNESDDVALLEFMTKYDEAQKPTKMLGTQKPALNNSSVKTDNSSKTDTSDNNYRSSLLKRNTTNSVSVQTPTHDVSLPMVKIEHVANESNSALSAKREVNSFDLKLKTEQAETELDTVLYPELRSTKARLDVDSNGISYRKKDEEEQSVVMRQDAIITHVNTTSKPTRLREDAQTIPVAMESEPTGQTEDNTSLASISKQLENDAAVDNEMNFWNDFCGYSELILNSQENALASIEDDLEDLYSTQTRDVEQENTIFANRDDENQAEDKSISTSYNDRLEMAVAPKETSTKIADKHVSFQGDTTVAATAASAGRPFGPQAGKPAETKPSKALKEEELFYEILTWKVLNLGKPEKNERPASLPRKLTAVPVPEKTGFESMDQYYDTFKPLLFMEIWEQVRQSI